MAHSNEISKFCMNLVKCWKYTGLPEYSLNQKKILCNSPNLRQFVFRLTLLIAIMLGIFWYHSEIRALDSPENICLTLSFSAIYIENIGSTIVCVLSRNQMALLFNESAKNGQEISDILQRPFLTRTVEKYAWNFIAFLSICTIFCAYLELQDLSYSEAPGYTLAIWFWYFGVIFSLQIAYFFTFSLFLLNAMYKALKDCIQQLASEEGSEDIEEHLEKCIKIFENQHDLNKLFNKTFGEIIFLRISRDFITSGAEVYYLYGFFRYIQEYNSGFEIFYKLLEDIAWFIVFGLPSVTIAIVFDQIEQTAEDLANSFDDLIAKTERNKRYRKTILLNLKNINGSFKFHALGMFPLNLQLISMIISGMVTYAVYIKQFEMYDHEGKEQ